MTRARAEMRWRFWLIITEEAIHVKKICNVSHDYKATDVDFQLQIVVSSGHWISKQGHTLSLSDQVIKYNTTISTWLQQEALQDIFCSSFFNLHDQTINTGLKNSSGRKNTPRRASKLTLHCLAVNWYFGFLWHFLQVWSPSSWKSADDEGQQERPKIIKNS